MKPPKPPTSCPSSLDFLSQLLHASHVPKWALETWAAAIDSSLPHLSSPIRHLTSAHNGPIPSSLYSLSCTHSGPYYLLLEMVQLQSNWSSPSTQVPEGTFLNKKLMVLFPALKSCSDSPLPQRESCDQDPSWHGRWLFNLNSHHLLSRALHYRNIKQPPVFLHIRCYSTLPNWICYSLGLTILPLHCCTHLSRVNSCLTSVWSHSSLLTDDFNLRPSVYWVQTWITLTHLNYWATCLCILQDKTRVFHLFMTNSRRMPGIK